MVSPATTIPRSQVQRAGGFNDRGPGHSTRWARIIRRHISRTNTPLTFSASTLMTLFRFWKSRPPIVTKGGPRSSASPGRRRRADEHGHQSGGRGATRAAMRTLPNNSVATTPLNRYERPATAVANRAPDRRWHQAASSCAPAASRAHSSRARCRSPGDPSRHPDTDRKRPAMAPSGRLR
jgi:hypothetical protein